MWKRVSKSGWVWLTSLGLYVTIRYELLVTQQTVGPAGTILWAVPFSYTVLWFGNYAPARFARISRIGDLSYGTYIWHMIFVNFLVFFSIPSLFPGDGTWLILALILFTLAIAWLSWHLIEKPFLGLKSFTSRSRSLTDEQGCLTETPGGPQSWRIRETVSA
jgi:peptidoglycan/LPS O-acetylase OafA/YrhL